MRTKWLAALSAVPVTVALLAAPASGAVSSKVKSEWTNLEKALIPANQKWSAILEQSTTPTVQALAKAGAAYAVALKAFDKGLAAIDFTGKTKSDVGSLIKVDGTSITVISHITSLSSFEKGYAPVFAKYEQLQVALGKDLGIPTADIII